MEVACSMPHVSLHQLWFHCPAKVSLLFTLAPPNGKGRYCQNFLGLLRWIQKQRNKSNLEGLFQRTQRLPASALATWVAAGVEASEKFKVFGLKPVLLMERKQKRRSLTIALGVPQSQVLAALAMMLSTLQVGSDHFRHVYTRLNTPQKQHFKHV